MSLNILWCVNGFLYSINWLIKYENARWSNQFMYPFFYAIIISLTMYCIIIWMATTPIFSMNKMDLNGNDEACGLVIFRVISHKWLANSQSGFVFSVIGLIIMGKNISIYWLIKYYFLLLQLPCLPKQEAKASISMSIYTSKMDESDSCKNVCLCG